MVRAVFRAPGANERQGEEGGAEYGVDGEEDEQSFPESDRDDGPLPAVGRRIGDEGAALLWEQFPRQGPQARY